MPIAISRCCRFLYFYFPTTFHSRISFSTQPYLPFPTKIFFNQIVFPLLSIVPFPSLPNHLQIRFKPRPIHQKIPNNTISKAALRNRFHPSSPVPGRFCITLGSPASPSAEPTASARFRLVINQESSAPSTVNTQESPRRRHKPVRRN